MEGNNHTISNLTIYTSRNNNILYGLFGTLLDATIKNITFDNVHLDYNNNALNYTYYRAGLLAGRSRGDTTISNITIIDSSVKGTRNYVGGLIGVVNSTDSSLTIDHIKTENFKIFGKVNYVGGLIGNIEDEVSSVSISNIDFEGEVFSNGNNSYQGGLIGRVKNGPTVSINQVVLEFKSINTIETNSTYYNKYTKKYIGGLRGYNMSTSDNLSISHTFLTGDLITQTDAKCIYVGTLFGRNTGSYNGDNNFFAAVQFKNTSGNITYDPDINAVGVFSTEVNNGTMPSVTWWNNFSNSFNMDIWSQDLTGRLYLA